MVTGEIGYFNHQDMRTMAHVFFIDSYPTACIGFVKIIEEVRKDLKVQVVNGTKNLDRVPDGVVPDLLILASNTPKGEDPAHQFMECKGRWPSVPIIFFDEDVRPQCVRALIKLGVSGYLLKMEPIAELVTCIEKVLKGRQFLSREGRRRHLASQSHK